MLTIKPVSRQDFSQAPDPTHTVGKATCPCCNMEVYVMNDQGHRGHEYLVDHLDQMGKKCVASLEFLANLKT